MGGGGAGSPGTIHAGKSENNAGEGPIKSDKIHVIEKGNKHLDGRTKSPQPKSTIGKYLNPQGKAALSGSRDEQTLNPQNQPYSQKGTAR